MIKDVKHATAVQERRYKAGKRGTAKAVRRFFARNPDKRGWLHAMPTRWERPA